MMKRAPWEVFMDKEILMKLISGFNAQMDKVKTDEGRLEAIRAQFVRNYSVVNIQNLTKESYCTGLGKTTFCYRIENELKELGDMHGSYASKFGLYYGKWGEDKKKEYRIVPKFGDDPDAAMKKIKQAIIELLIAANNADEESIRDSRLSQIFRSKILGTYYPDKYLNIYSEEHLDFFLKKIGIAVDLEADLLEKQKVLINWMKEQPGTESWTLLTFEKFLYEQIGQPKKIAFKPEVEMGATLSNNDLHEIFGVGNMGGMRRSQKNNLLLIVSDHTKSFYEDKWYGDVLYYTGMGKFGDQQLTSQNKTLAESNKNGVAIYLCEVLESGKYIFHGRVQLVQDPFQQDQKDSEGTLRKVWIFPVKVVDANDVIDKEILDRYESTKEQKAKGMSEEELKQKAKEHSGKKSSYRSVASTTYVRDPYIAEYAKNQAKGICQLCGQKAPFNDKDGNPYLESHHIIWLSKGGDDSIENTVALCPNCHRKMHVIANEQDVKLLQEKNKKID